MPIIYPSSPTPNFLSNGKAINPQVDLRKMCFVIGLHRACAGTKVFTLPFSAGDSAKACPTELTDESEDAQASGVAVANRANPYKTRKTSIEGMPVLTGVYCKRIAFMLWLHIQNSCWIFGLSV